nr:transposase [Methylosinus sp. C49]
MRSGGERIRDDALAHIAPLGWEHITFNGGLCLARPNRSRMFSNPSETRGRSYSTRLGAGFWEDSATTQISSPEFDEDAP